MHSLYYFYFSALLLLSFFDTRVVIRWPVTYTTTTFVLLILYISLSFLLKYHYW